LDHSVPDQLLAAWAVGKVDSSPSSPWIIATVDLDRNWQDVFVNAFGGPKASCSFI
jgi:hypothetical protein